MLTAVPQGSDDGGREREALMVGYLMDVIAAPPQITLVGNDTRETDGVDDDTLSSTSTENIKRCVSLPEPCCQIIAKSCLRPPKYK